MSCSRRTGSSGTGAATIVALLALVAAMVALGSAGAFGAERAKPGHRAEKISLPDGFQPEGIAAHANDFFVGSISSGAIFEGDLRTGDGAILVPGEQGRSAIGLALRRRVLFVAGGETGTATSYDARTGEELDTVQLTSAQTFVNDVVATRDAAYFTDSVNPVVYRVPIEKGGRLGEVEPIPLTGDLVYEQGFNVNGIDATPNGKSLVVVQSNTGELFEVDPRTGASAEIDLGGETVVNGDGILLEGGHRLWVVQNEDNLLTLVRLDPSLGSGRIADRVTNAGFDVPTTVARSGSRLAVVNARFGTPDPESAEYWVTQIRR